MGGLSLDWQIMSIRDNYASQCHSSISPSVKESNNRLCGRGSKFDIKGSARVGARWPPHRPPSGSTRVITPGIKMLRSTQPCRGTPQPLPSSTKRRSPLPRPLNPKKRERNHHAESSPFPHGPNPKEAARRLSQWTRPSDAAPYSNISEVLSIVMARDSQRRRVRKSVSRSMRLSAATVSRIFLTFIACLIA